MQILTVHAAKGLEWDVVAVAGLVEASFPAHSASRPAAPTASWAHAAPKDKGWLAGLADAALRLRGDATASRARLAGRAG